MKTLLLLLMISISLLRFPAQAENMIPLSKEEHTNFVLPGCGLIAPAHAGKNSPYDYIPGTRCRTPEAKLRTARQDGTCLSEHHVK